MKKQLPWRAIFLFVLVVLAVIIPFLIWEEPITQWTKETFQTYRNQPVLIGGILYAVLALDVVLPTPSCLISMGCGAALGFWWGTFVSFLAMTTCSILGYLIGRFSTKWALKLIGARDMAFLEQFEKQYGEYLLLALRPVPVLAEASTVFAGLGKERSLRALVHVLVGNLAVSMIYAGVGAWGKINDSMLPAFGVTMLLTGIFLFFNRRSLRKSQRNGQFSQEKKLGEEGAR